MLFSGRKFQTDDYIFLQLKIYKLWLGTPVCCLINLLEELSLLKHLQSDETVNYAFKDIHSWEHFFPCLNISWSLEFYLGDTLYKQVSWLKIKQITSTNSTRYLYLKIKRC